MHYLQFSNRRYKGQRIVKCISDKAPIDPEETKKKIQPVFEKSEEYKKQQELSAQKVALFKEQHSLNVEYARSFESSSKVKRREQIKKRYEAINQELAVLEDKLIEHSKITERTYQELFQKKAVYSTPRNALLIDKEKKEYWEKALQSLKPSELILMDKTIITLEQIEIERIASLTDEKKEKEKNGLIAMAMSQAIQLRNQLEILNDEKALDKSQKWFEAEKAKIEEQYT